jgi:hypothetical protein
MTLTLVLSTSRSDSRLKASARDRGGTGEDCTDYEGKVISTHECLGRGGCE